MNHLYSLDIMQEIYYTAVGRLSIIYFLRVYLFNTRYSLTLFAISKLKPNLFALVTLYIDLPLSFQPSALNTLKNGTLFVCVKVLVTEVKALDFTLYHSFLVFLYT